MSNNNDNPGGWWALLCDGEDIIAIIHRNYRPDIFEFHTVLSSDCEYEVCAVDVKLK